MVCWLVGWLVGWLYVSLLLSWTLVIRVLRLGRRGWLERSRSCGGWMVRHFFARTCPKFLFDVNMWWLCSVSLQLLQWLRMFRGEEWKWKC